MKKEERFTEEQRQELALLHQDIDEFVANLYYHHGNSILLDLTPQTDEDEVKKKLRCVIGFEDENEIQNGYNTVLIYENRMNEITDNIMVHSIKNKLPHFFLNASRLTVSSSSSFKASFKSLTRVQDELDVLSKVEAPDEENLFKRTIYEKVIDFMIKNQMEFIDTRNKIDRITFNVFDHQNEPILNKVGFFQGGVIVPIDCSIRTPVVRKFRSDRIKEEEILHLTENFIFILKKRIQNEN